MSTDGTKPPSFTPTSTGPQRTSVRTQERGAGGTGGASKAEKTDTAEAAERVDADEQVRGARPSPVVPGSRPHGPEAQRPQGPERTAAERTAPDEAARQDDARARAERERARVEREERPASGPVPAGVGPRRVRLALARVDPWSVMKLAFLLSFAVGIMIVVTAAVVWSTLNSMGVFVSINTTIAEITGSDTFFDLLEYVAFDRVMALATIIAIVDVVLLTALATLFAFLYNIVAALVGGVHVTLTDD